MGELRKTIVLVGMMGAGKTAVGSALARRLDVAFLDSDTEIERAAARTITEIFARDGESFFRDREQQVIARLLEGPPCVLAVGGGAFLSQENRRLISERAVSVWLRAPAGLLWQRVKTKPTRPLLKTPDPRATLERLTRERAEHYAKADLVVDARAGVSAAQMARLVESELARRPDLMENTA